MAKWYRPDDVNFRQPMDDIALSVYLTRMRTAQQKLIRHYEKFAEYRNTHTDEIVSKAQKVDPAKIHQPLEDILKKKGIEVDTAIDFIGGSGKHAKWLFDQQGCNVIYSDVKNLTEQLPSTFEELETQPQEDGSLLLFKKEDPDHWVYGISALPNEAYKVGLTMRNLKKNGLSKEDRANLFLGNDMLFAVPEEDDKNFVRAVDDALLPGAILDLSGRTMIKYGRAIKNIRQLTEMFGNYDILYAAEENPVSEKESAQNKKHVRVILQKPGVAA